MFVYATKITVKKAAIGLLALAAVIWGVASLRPAADVQTVSMTESTDLSQKLSTNEQRVKLLEGCGWQVDAQPVSETEVRIPDEFDAAYAQYNALQKQQGLDLEKYKGRRAKLYVYNVRNDPSGEQGVTANLVLYRNRLIAADICSSQKDGFLRTITERPAADGASS